MESSKITSIIAHIDHGKTTLIDSIIASTGYFSKSLIGDLRYLDNRKDEQEREITMKLSPIKLANGHTFIDTPGHVDFENLLYSSSILSDNHIILIDVNEGITPRTYSLVKFINKTRSILVLNKVDKCVDIETINLVLMQINGLLGEEIFEWAKNNVILSSATLGSGLSFGTFKLSSKNTLQQAFKAFKTLDDKINANDVDQIMKKYKINFFNKKIIFSTVMPLHEAIFNTVDYIYSSNKHNIDQNLGLKIDNEFFTATFDIKSSVVGITPYGIFKNRNDYRRENIIQLVKLYNGKINKGDYILSTSENDQRSVLVEGIFDFSIDEFNEIDSFEGQGLIFLRGNFLKNSIISTKPVNLSFKRFLTPFFTSKLISNDLGKIDDMKAAIRAISFSEPNLKVKLNKFSEFEFRCSGNVQFEKICYDLKECGFDFTIKNSKREFREFSTRVERYKNEFLDLFIVIGPFSSFDENIKNELNIDQSVGYYKHNTITNNIYYIEGAGDRHIIENVLDIFTGSGSVINESIMNTFFYVKSEKEKDLSFFNILKNVILDVYLKSCPSICPLCFTVMFSVSKEYVPIIYLSLQKCDYLIESEDYNEDNEFITIKCVIPQFMFNSIVNEVRVRSKGTAYLDVCGSGYQEIGDFSYLIKDIRKEKGLCVDDVVIEDPDKQRTLKR